MMVELPDDCPHVNGEECPVVEQNEKQNKRRRADSWQASLKRIVALLGVLASGLGGGAWYAKTSNATAQQAAAVDTTAREEAQRVKQDLAVFQAEMKGDIRILRQQQDQIIETLREMRDDVRRGQR